MASTLIVIDSETRQTIARLAEPYMGKAECLPLMGQIGSLLTGLNPRRSVKAAHIEHEPDLWVPQIRVLVVVDGEWDQGIVIRRGDPIPANDFQITPIRKAA